MTNTSKNRNSPHRGIKFICFFVCLAVLMGTAARAAEMTGEDQAKFGKAQSLNNLKKYDEAAATLKELSQKYPDERPIRLELAKALGYSRRWDEAAPLCQVLDKENPQDLDFQKMYVSILETNQQFEKAREKYSDFLKRAPKDLEMKLKWADASLWSGHTEDAISVYRELQETMPNNLDAKIRLADALLKTGKDREAVSVYRSILSQDPDHALALRGLARTLSWKGEYKESLELYDDLIKKNPDGIEAKREKARILGWKRRFRQALREYKKLAAAGAGAAIVREMNAKKNFYREHDSNAIRAYQLWLEEEPGNLEALFDLSQVYARQRQWAHARRMLGEILRIAPAHARAKQALRKVDQLSSSVLLQEDFGFFEADSASRSADQRYYAVDSRLRAPLRETLDLTAHAGSYFYDTSKRDIQNQRLGIGLEYFRLPRFSAKLGYDYNFYSDHIADSHNFQEEIRFSPFDFMTSAISHRREDVRDNAQTFFTGLRKDTYRIRQIFTPNRRLRLGGDYEFSHFNDGNDRHLQGYDVRLALLYEPRSFYVTYRYEEYGFRKTRADYFSPGSFHTHTLKLEWQQYLNRSELFWGAQDTYYRLAYEINFDVHDQRGHTLAADFYHEMANRLILSAGWRKKLYEHRDVYQEDELRASAGFVF